MTLDRRKFLSILSAAPLAPVAAQAASALPEVALTTEPTKFTPPLGYMMDMVEHTIAPAPGPHMPYSSYQAVSYVVKKIWDGEKFVNWDSVEGTEVMNRVLEKR